MKKNIVLLVCFLFTITHYSQNIIGPIKECITGPIEVTLGDVIEYSTSLSAQCGNCYDWDSSNENVLEIYGTDQNNTVSFIVNSIGCSTIEVTRFNENGCYTCSKEICVVEGCVDQIVEDDLHLIYDITDNGCNGREIRQGTISLEMGVLNNIPLENGPIDNVVYHASNFMIFFEFETTNNDYSIPVTNPVNNYKAHFLYNCQGETDIFFSAIITHTNGCKTIIYPFKVIMGQNNQPNVLIKENPTNQFIKLNIENSKNKKIVLKFYELNTGEIIITETLNNIIENKLEKVIHLPTNNHRNILMDVFVNNRKTQSLRILIK